MIGEHPYVKWAIEVIENYVRTESSGTSFKFARSIVQDKSRAFVTIPQKTAIARLYRYVHASTREPRL